jgi:hypothetical protein
LEKNCVPVEIEKLLKNAPIEPIFKYYKPDQCYSTSRTVTVVDKYLIEHDKTTDSIDILREIKDDSDSQISLIAFGMCVKFLEEHLLAE